MKYLILFILLIQGCGFNGHVDDINVRHIVTLEFPEVMEYCQAQCAIQYADPSLQQTCTNQCYQNFLSILTSSN